MEERVAKAVAACYDAVIAPENWADALHGLSRSIDAACMMFYPRDADKAALEVVPFSHDYKDFLEFYLEHRWYEGHYRGERGWPLLSKGRTVIEHDLATDEERRHLRHYNELYLPFGFHGFAAVGFKVEDRVWAAALLRYRNQGHFQPEEKRQLAELGTHFARMVGIAERLAMGQAFAGLGMLNQVACAAVLLDWRGAVAQANRQAEALFGQDFCVRGGKLAASDRTSNLELQELIRRLLARDASVTDEVPAPALIRRFDRRPLLVEALPVEGLFADVFRRTRALLLITDLDARPVPDEARLRRAFGLTPAEAGLAKVLTGGADLKHAAESRSVSYETARVQLKSIFDKTGVKRQADLVGLLARMR